jgi:hypothetical protein
MTPNKSSIISLWMLIATSSCLVGNFLHFLGR